MAVHGRCDGSSGDAKFVKYWKMIAVTLLSKGLFHFSVFLDWFMLTRGLKCRLILEGTPAILR